jgi:hypothetical protein
MSFCPINFFLDFLFHKQNANENLIHYISSQQNTNKPTKKNWNGVRKTTKYKIDKNIKTMQDVQQETILNWNLIYDKL